MQTPLSIYGQHVNSTFPLAMFPLFKFFIYFYLVIPSVLFLNIGLFIAQNCKRNPVRYIRRTVYTEPAQAGDNCPSPLLPSPQTTLWSLPFFKKARAFGFLSGQLNRSSQGPTAPSKTEISPSLGVSRGISACACGARDPRSGRRSHVTKRCRQLCLPLPLRPPCAPLRPPHPPPPFKTVSGRTPITGP